MWLRESAAPDITPLMSWFISDSRCSKASISAAFCFASCGVAYTTAQQMAAAGLKNKVQGVCVEVSIALVPSYRSQRAAQRNVRTPLCAVAGSHPCRLPHVQFWSEKATVCPPATTTMCCLPHAWPHQPVTGSDRRNIQLHRHQSGWMADLL